MFRCLPDRVAGLFYAHGLFCSSHPRAVISLAISIALLCCYPLVNVPMPGNAPRTVINHTVVPENNTENSVFYVQQVVLRVGIVPWTEELTLMDAFRGPLYEIFNLLEIIQNYQHPETLKTLGQVCLHVEAVKRRNGKKSEILPEYNCLVLSPANLWQRSIELFAQDTNLINTIYSYQNLQKGKISLAEIMFGMNLKETGIKRYPIRLRQRILQYAVTIFLKDYDPQFIKGLQHRLKSYYPLYQVESNSTGSTLIDETLHIFYPGEFNYSDFFPLMMTFFALFFYVYFSVRKIELVKSKIGIAFSATVTVIGSLSMTVGVCFFFGLTLSLSGKEVFPYLVIIVGLENVLVLTKSVVSTPAQLDVKIRVAQALSKEGWSITKNLLTEVTILTIGLFTFVPAIQEFCIFAIVGLVNDFFLQMVFFSTILAIDIKRTELSSENSKLHFPNIPASRKQFTTTITNRKPNIFRSKSHPRLNGLSNGPTNVIAPNTQNTHTLGKIPKRLRLVHFWARTRIFQRAFMVWMVVWISMIIYNSGIIEHVIHLSETLKTESDIEGYTVDRSHSLNNYVELNTMKPVSIPSATIVPDHLSKQGDLANNVTEELNKLKPVDFPPWNRLSLYHWSSILSMYNISAAGERVTILPTVKLSHAVSPQLVKQISNPNDVQHFQWQSLATAALDPLDFSDMELPGRGEGRGFNADAPFIPSSPMEIFLAAVLCLISVIVVAYTMVVLYRCICSRNYAEWRASWYQPEKAHDSATQLVLEALPLVLEGHTQEVECIATDSNTIASTCLAGHIRVWDATSGEQLVHIDRKQFFSSPQKNLNHVTPDMDELMSDYESGSPPSRGEMENTNSFGLYSAVHYRKSSPGLYHHRPQSKRHSMGNAPDYDYQIKEFGLERRKNVRKSLDNDYDLPDLKSAINIKFSSMKHTPQQSSERGYDFGDRYKHLLEEHNKSIDELQTLECLEQLSAPSGRFNSSGLPDNVQSSFSTDKNMQINHAVPPIWCMDYQENLIVVGCANGNLEFWEGTTGKFKCFFDDGSGIGLSAVKFVGSKVIAAKLNGSIDFLQLESYSEGQQIDWGFTSYRRTHVRTGSAGSPMDINNIMQTEEDLRCIKIASHKAHQQAITVLDSEGGRVLTGSQDHTLKVYRLEDQLPLYTLHGHCGPISCLFIDRMSPMTSGSGSQDGLLCVWDLLTGTCMYSIQAHDGAVAAITCSVSYVISIGTDERLCVWERFQGHLLHALPAHRTAYSLQLVMLTHHLLITSNQGSLVVWDVRTGEPVREVRLGHKDSCIFVKQMLALRDSVVCDFGRQLRIVRFPLVSDKLD
ncbi:sterol regulatory element-binding protein cleavage-activating protein [Ceratina calcarata]|uniref:Sterol regulatory element-binding protein cleavage-activating protein n=1 Tax=Ceratina calcarata TaxID=156304 RepID=A0AAJ7W9L4_9HYME|nr:sterol regulatory element-binding protein cleavage-activating protein [Ceratina calcarata]XP_026667461.1 sterol regulatory element-binding protein cleavage-activating protein [Ceratina calcarata]XP_026667462.1 sterol regulatory element-binding protein cleavage-activating protein [Ceratina calcarata]XP_026667463.1 sterol regulatory element-binding protein cleavage-activating protein [Ceratina calcarata]